MRRAVPPYPNPPPQGRREKRSMRSVILPPPLRQGNRIWGRELDSMPGVIPGAEQFAAEYSVSMHKFADSGTGITHMRLPCPCGGGSGWGDRRKAMRPARRKEIRG